MATGKTNVRHFRFLHGGYNLSGDTRALGSAGLTFSETDVTGWSDEVINFTMGTPVMSIEGYQAIFNNTAITGSHIVLSALPDSYASLFMGIRAAPAIGDPTFAMPAKGSEYRVVGDAPVTINYRAVTAQTGVYSAGGFPLHPWGNALAVGANLTSSNAGTSVNNGASSANGAVGYLHVTASSGGTWSFKIQDSADDSAWADLITFTADGSAVTAEQGTATGTVDQYTRLLCTRTSGTVTVWCNVIRL